MDSPITSPDRWQALLTSTTPDRALKNLRYVIGTVNDDALRVWTELWHALEPGMSQSGMVLPEMDDGFKPQQGWPEFLEKLWLLKHYLDVVGRLCKQPLGTASSPSSPPCRS